MKRLFHSAESFCKEPLYLLYAAFLVLFVVLYIPMWVVQALFSESSEEHIPIGGLLRDLQQDIQTTGPCRFTSEGGFLSGEHVQC